jgi:hypothetical protein
MDPRDDDDIEFDFFDDEPATREAQPASFAGMRLPRRGGTGTGPRRPAAGAAGRRRVGGLLALTTIGVLVLLAFGLLINSCAEPSAHSEYSSYSQQVATIAKSSQDDGTQVANTLITPAAKPVQLATKLNGIAANEQQNVRAAERIVPPGRLRAAHQALIEALELRVSGTQGLAQAFASNPSSKGTGESAVLAQQADRLLASDVVWSDLFVGAARRVLAQQNVTGVQIPESTYVRNPQLISANSMSLVLKRLRGTSTGGTVSGLHGTNIVSTKVEPGGATLSESTLNTVTASTSLQFVVTVHDGGDSQEVGIPVTLTIEKPQGAIVKTQTIQLINPGQDESVTFSNLGTVPIAMLHGHVDVSVKPVRGERDVNNNKASYPVIFSLPGG